MSISLILCNFSFYAVNLVSDNLVKIRDLIREASESWFDLGLELGLKPAKLSSIESRYSDAKACFRCMLLEWLKMINPPPTWEALIAALKNDNVGLPSVANKVEERCGVVDSELTHSGAGKELIYCQNLSDSVHTVYYVSYSVLSRGRSQHT